MRTRNDFVCTGRLRKSCRRTAHNPWASASLRMGAVLAERPRMPLHQPVTHHMKTPVFGVGASADLEAARALLDRYGISCLVVRDHDDRAVGAISRTDL